MKPMIDLWANFMKNEHISPDKIGDNPKVLLKLLELCRRLAELQPPEISMHKDKLRSRALVCQVAMEMEFDLPAIRGYKNGKLKPIIGRGLLDAWNIEYAKKFGSNLGTNGVAEVRRRTIVTRLMKDQS